MSKLTPWFDGSTKPVHIGPYERDYGQEETGEPPEYQYWNGVHWLYGCEKVATTVEMAVDRPCNINPYDRRWRGLTSPARMEAKK